jgi:hypothetical protein
MNIGDRVIVPVGYTSEIWGTVIGFFSSAFARGASVLCDDGIIRAVEGGTNDEYR